MKSSISWKSISKIKYVESKIDFLFDIVISFDDETKVVNDAKMTNSVIRFSLIEIDVKIIVNDVAFCIFSIIVGFSLLAWFLVSSLMKRFNKSKITFQLTSFWYSTMSFLRSFDDISINVTRIEFSLKFDFSTWKW